MTTLIHFDFKGINQHRDYVHRALSKHHFFHVVETFGAAESVLA